MEPYISFTGSTPPQARALPTSRIVAAEALLWGIAAILVAGLSALWTLRPTLTSEFAPDQINPFTGQSYLGLPAFESRLLYAVQGDGNTQPSRSKLVLFENGTPLGPAHAPHGHIAEHGRGAFSHWGGAVLFSSSDGTDPRINGRRYTVRTTAAPRSAILWPTLASAALAAAGALGLRHGAAARARFRSLNWPVAGRSAAAAATALATGLTVAEGFTRLATHPAIDFTSIFSPGPYCSDQDLLWAVACPHDEGVMRAVGDGQRYAFYRLNEFGFRGPFRSRTATAKAVKKVVILGGQSQGFGFGLNDDETYAAVAAQSGCGPVEVHDIALLGTPNPLTWDVYKLRMADRPKEDHIILALFWHPEQDRVASFNSYDGIMSSNAVLYGWGFSVPPRLPKPLWSVHTVVRSIQTSARAGGWLTQTFAPVLPVSEASAASGEGPEDMPKSKQPPPGQAFIHAVADWALQRGAKFSVVMLPNAPGANSVSAGLNGIRVLDLDAAARAAGVIRPGWLLPDFIHYNVETAAFIGREIGREICAVDFPESAGASTFANVAQH